MRGEAAKPSATPTLMTSGPHNGPIARQAIRTCDETDEYSCSARDGRLDLYSPVFIASRAERIERLRGRIARLDVYPAKRHDRQHKSRCLKSDAVNQDVEDAHSLPAILAIMMSCAERLAVRLPTPPPMDAACEDFRGATARTSVLLPRRSGMK
ncbi:hypothetical protein [Bradyrhizobium sp. NP1]|uniref:hypothetical protein n=1 Tax=Bradyrhizobium sp. NP1 TaxID=3049772 RepID=UPI0025A54182|nr:hypothetical protein [Bradyrhizobium sp. NP1]WJR76480.1 hypothetical protein QOU61_27505 [Bradyrhizobium sp. NP1]